MVQPTRNVVPLLDHRIASYRIMPRLDAAIAGCDKALAAVVALPDDQRTFANTVEAIEQAGAAFSDTAQRLSILKEIHPNQAVRDVAAQSEEKASQYAVKVGARRDLYRTVMSYIEKAGKTEQLEPEQQRLLVLMRREFRRNGLELPDDKLKRLVELRQRMSTLSIEFQQHLNENNDSVTVSEEELAGLPTSFVERLPKAPEGGRTVTTKYPDYVPFMENAKNGDARKRLYLAFNRREVARNGPILHEAIALRDEAAKLLGYSNHADFVTEDRMAKSGANVASFLKPLGEKLLTRRDADYEKLLVLKREETGDQATTLNPWDLSYLLNKLKRRDFDLDTETIREYFPAESVMREMFGVYEDMLSIAMRQIPEADVWAPSVKLYEVRDRESSEILAYFYTDLYPRAGKFGHAAVAPISVPRLTPQGYNNPISVLMANFTPASGDRPALLTHDEVRTLFHEFGHVMHQSLTTARYGSQAGFSVAGDFVEAPSQMLENWIYKPAVLDRLSGHFTDPNKKLPLALIEKMEAARFFDAGYRYTRQVFLAQFDQALHTRGADVDVLKTEQETFRSIMGMEPAAEAFLAPSFGHLLGGYDAGYYGYLWSEVFAADMFTLFEREGLMNATLGRKYRDTILAKGRSIEPEELLKEFLGREPSSTSFLHRLGVA